MAKQVLITCDSCGGVVPVESIRKWWGLANTGGDVPDMKFAPLCQRNLGDFQSHACSENCLTKLLMAFAESVDMKKVATAKERPTFLTFSSLMSGSWLGATDTGDSIGYYGKKSAPKAEDEDEDEGGDAE